jgi:hypothetical protein
VAMLHRSAVLLQRQPSLAGFPPPRLQSLRFRLPSDSKLYPQGSRVFCKVDWPSGLTATSMKVTAFLHDLGATSQGSQKGIRLASGGLAALSTPDQLIGAGAPRAAIRRSVDERIYEAQWLSIKAAWRYERDITGSCGPACSWGSAAYPPGC